MLIIEKNDILLIIPGLVLLTIGVFATAWTNREYRTYQLNDRLKLKGLFWGQKEIETDQLKGFKVKERKNTTNIIPFSEYDIIILTVQYGQLTIREDNYKFTEIQKFKSHLENKGVPFLGTEKFSWIKSFKDLLKLKILE